MPAGAPALAAARATPALRAAPAPDRQRPAACVQALHQPIQRRSLNAGSRDGTAAAAATAQRLQRRRGLVAVRAGPSPGPGGSWKDRQQRKVDNQIVLAVGVGLTALVVLALRLGGAAVDSADAAPFELGDVSLGPGDGLGGLLWAASLYYCSPLQLLLLFFGFIEVERPSDWVLRRLGLAAGLDVDALDYSAPAGLQAATAALFLAGGGAVAVALQALLGDATWSVSTGLGACFGAAMYEVGRPQRLSVEEAQAKERVWQDFARWADGRLQRGGRCHESEVIKALARDLPRYRAAGALDSIALRQLVKNWAPGAERSSAGYYKGISLAPASGTAAAAATAAQRQEAVSSVDASTDQY